MKLLFLDTETRSRTDISAGTDRYTRDAQCMILTYAHETGPAKIWLPIFSEVMQNDLRHSLADPETTLVAHNAAFDRLILDRALNIRTALSRWFCTMACASAHGLPGSLEALGKVCGLTEDEGKLTDDKGLIHTFCEPQAATGKFIEPHEAPVEFGRFCKYAIRDTEALRAIYYKMPRHNYGY